jgi:hypothetical protein
MRHGLAALHTKLLLVATGATPTYTGKTCSTNTAGVVVCQGVTNFLKSDIGVDLQHFCQWIAIPLCLYVTYLIFHRIWRKSHKEAFFYIVLTCILLAVMLDLSLLTTIWGGAAQVGKDIVNII